MQMQQGNGAMQPYNVQNFAGNSGGMTEAQWSNEVQRPGNAPWGNQGMWPANQQMSWNTSSGQSSQTNERLARWQAMISDKPLNMTPPLSQEAIDNPVTQSEVDLGGLKGLLGRNLGHYVVATFVVGVSNFVVWRGILESVGNDYLVIYQPNQDRHVSCDFYSLKFIEFHNSYDSILGDGLEWAGA